MLDTKLDTEMEAIYATVEDISKSVAAQEHLRAHAPHPGRTNWIGVAAALGLLLLIVSGWRAILDLQAPPAGMSVPELQVELTKEVVWVVGDLRAVAEEWGRPLVAEEVRELELIPEGWSYNSNGRFYVLTATDGDAQVIYDSREDLGAWLDARRLSEATS